MVLDEYCKEEGLKAISVSGIGVIIKKEKMYYELDGRYKIRRKKGKRRRKEDEAGI